MKLWSMVMIKKPGYPQPQDIFQGAGLIIFLNRLDADQCSFPDYGE